MPELEISSEQQPIGLIRYVGFDMDGTIRDSLAEYTHLFGQLMHEEYNIDTDEASKHFTKTAGQPTPDQISTLLKKHGITISPDKAFEEGNRVASYLGQHSDAPPFPEVLDALKSLKERGYSIFVSSGHQEKVVKGFLEKSGLITYVDFFAGIRPEEPTFKKGEPHFQAAARHFGVPFNVFVRKTVFIGDTPTDMKEANASGILAIARSGINTEQVLLNLGAKLVLPDFSNLSAVLLSFQDFEDKKRKYIANFAARYTSAFRPHYKIGETLGKAEGVWRNVSEHCIVAGIFADILSEKFGLSPDDKDKTIKAAILHDWDKKHEVFLLNSASANGTQPTLQTFEEIKGENDSKLRELGISEDIIALSSANVPKTEEGPQTDAEKIVWYVDMMLANTEPLPIIDRFEKVEQGWDGQKYDPERAARLQSYLNIYREKFNGRHLNEVQRDLAVKLNQEFAARLGFGGDPNDVPLYLKRIFNDRVEKSQALGQHDIFK